MSDLLKKAYDPDTFRKKGYELIDLLAEYLQKMQSPDLEDKVIDPISPEALFEFWKKDLDNPIGDFYKKALPLFNHIHHPKYIGHQTSPASPDAVLAEMFSAFLDTGMGVYEQGHTGVVLERLIIEILSKKMQIPENQSSGFLTSGGTLGNLTALLCARAVMIPKEVWKKGYLGKQYAFMVSEEAHYSVDKAIRTMGLGAAGLIKIPVDEKYRMDMTQLEKYYQKAKSEGVIIIGVIANACTTAVGAHDPIDAIADFCTLHKLWLHVDAAHGGALLFSKKYRHFLKGIDRADSVILDFHKMLLTPSLVTAVVFKNGNHSYQTFAQKASYLWDNAESLEWYNLAKRTFELTKTTMSLRVYTLLRTYGEQLFEEYLDRQYDLARVFAQMIKKDGHFEMPVETPESNILCFRYIDKSLSSQQIDQLNLQIREALVNQGSFFIVQTRIKEQLYLRTTLINPFTTDKILADLLKEIKKTAHLILKSSF
jgi:L-2,4-diaminobutyrate decarboxylase